jgi:DNA polymerase-4
MMKAAFRKILHLDMDAFFCAVEELKDPSLAGKAFAVGGKSSQRGVISTCSYEARKYGVHSAMPTAQAFKVCPQLLLISGFHHDYSEKSAEVMQLLHQLTGLVEQVSVDEAFLDVTDLSQSLEQIAKTFKKRFSKKPGCLVRLEERRIKWSPRLPMILANHNPKVGGIPVPLRLFLMVKKRLSSHHFL